MFWVNKQRHLSAQNDFKLNKIFMNHHLVCYKFKNRVFCILYSYWTVLGELFTATKLHQKTTMIYKFYHIIVIVITVMIFQHQTFAPWHEQPEKPPESNLLLSTDIFNEVCVISDKNKSMLIRVNWYFVQVIFLTF